MYDPAEMYASLRGIARNSEQLDKELMSGPKFDKTNRNVWCLMEKSLFYIENKNVQII